MIKRLKRFLSNVWSIIRLPEMMILPGQLAFFFVLSVVPIITLIGYGASFFNLSMDFIKNFLQQAFSTEIADMIFPVIKGSNLGVQFFISLSIGFIIASNGADSIIITSNTIYGIPNGGYIRRRIKAVVMTILMVLLFMFFLVVPAFGNEIVEMVKYVDLNSLVTANIEYVIKFLQSPISWFIMFLFIKIIYTMAPDRSMPSSNVNLGAIFTTIGWGMITFIYSFYITHFAHYDVFYGGLANIVILMLWVYFLAYIFVIGMALNNKEEELAKTASIKLE